VELEEKTQGLITEEMVQKYYHLSKKAKEIDRELSKLKKVFHKYFDLTEGVNQGGELSFENYILQRQIRVSERFKEEEAVLKLEEMNLQECIKVEKRVDGDKIQAAMTLGLIDQDLVEGWKERKHTAAIVVREK